MADNTYSPQTPPIQDLDYKSFGPDSMDENKKLMVYNDGSVLVENIEERTADGLSYELDKKNNYVYFSNNLDANTKVKYIPKNVDKVYCTTINKTFSIKGALAVFKNDVRKFIVKNLDRYKTSKKSLKKEIDKILLKKNQFLWTEKRLSSEWNKTYVDSVTLGPYSCDTTLTVTKDIEMINDLIVIKTGDWGQLYDSKTKKMNTVARAGKIVWVSPHEILNYSGEANYYSSGEVWTYNTTNSGVYSGETFLNVSYGVGNNRESYGLSSRFIKIPKDTQIKTEFPYEEIPRDETQLFLDTRQGVGIEKQFFNGIYSEWDWAQRVLTGTWDGVVPSGSYIELQTWSTNPQFVGFNGEITVKPVDTTLVEDIDLSYNISATASDLNYQASVRKAVQKAKNVFYKKLNKHLVSKGLKKKSSNLKRYDKMLERVAQNVYDGLSFVRNENIAKIQGLESNPLDGPIYYDGTAKMYGGSKEEADYDYSRTKSQRSYLGLNPSSTSQSTSSKTNAGDMGGSY